MQSEAFGGELRRQFDRLEKLHHNLQHRHVYYSVLNNIKLKKNNLGIKTLCLSMLFNLTNCIESTGFQEMMTANTLFICSWNT
jgi:hypothetical protein